MTEHDDLYDLGWRYERGGWFHPSIWERGRPKAHTEETARRSEAVAPEPIAELRLDVWLLAQKVDTMECEVQRLLMRGRT